ncbi:DNA-binding transcriptional regulator, LysR family [Methylobacterium phyllostachyos]|uniref:DNA-binding transcriptional regulator, LysR family n=1 Tax=Methylobacterium phyllostachyos TaxID=582672 RepID=A0A1G9ZD59_9HYPH|nr:LysR family transcriptional regulator [Methylobacterium phyllostachyos]SDN18393.1 DNA-binding transcriptional regulator, LysR family [Methylobacterium phyllostachyos]
MPDWQSIRVFLVLERSGSFRAAASKLGVSVNSVRRRIDDLEAQIGTPLLTRHVDGIRLTAEGQAILESAGRMEAAAFGLIRTSETAPFAEAGEVRIAVTEGLGAFWLAPRLVEFQRANPRLTIDLRCAMESADVLRLEADVAIQLTRPTSPDLRVVKLGRMHLLPYAARNYEQTYGLPAAPDELARHRIVVQASGQTIRLEDYSQAVPGFPSTIPITLKVNVSSAYYWAIAKGAGIGLLPTYASAIGAQVVPVDNLGRFSRDIWLTFHPDVERIDRVRRTIDWLRAAFDGRRFPWFRDEFIHPRDLPTAIKGELLPDLFAGFTAMTP